ncbi:Rrf2 family transcriptional regulator [Candidatus Nitronereus thalassa]|uniref:Rrf2 family transcriptional regulator n=1 Tax=Candidatus Nitronereus thalassa TaxID=3020898 RepID=A0ABU3K6V8_9BACT|nr:Rrf2 family transcriptional regulator [Candidatus Nitronereus thalassa]MDT7042169.1 Rrf2 family transcriptional regulator [Candidatus Nitronereus thalassa]
MLKFSKKADYALLALQYMASVQGGGEVQPRVVNTKEIAEEHFMPVELLAKVLQTLARQQIIESHHNGPKGGYVLGREAKDITIAQVLEAIEGPLGITDCYHEKDQSSCDQMDRCNIRTPLLKIQESIYALLNGMSIEDMLLDESPLIIVESLKPQGVNS